MKRLVEVFQISDGTWYLRIACIDTDTGVLIVNTLIPCLRLVTAIDTASMLQVHIGNIADLPLNQYNKGA